MFGMVVIYSEVDIDNIDKCMVDKNCEFIKVPDIDAEIKKRKEDFFAVLREDYFSMYVFNKEIKCDYNCRNLVMRNSDRLNYFYNEFTNKNGISYPFGNLYIADNIVINGELPYILFMRENDFISRNGTEDNTVVEYYDDMDILKFADIAKSKNVQGHFFVVYLGNDNYQCFNTHNTTMSYKYSSQLKSRVTWMVIEEISNIDKLIQEDKELPNRRPKVERKPNFNLIDFAGEKVDEDKIYSLKIYNEEKSNDEDNDDDDGDDDDYHEHDAIDIFENELIGVLSNVDFEVTCETRDGITYIKHGGQYLYAPEDEENSIRLTPHLPKAEERLQFHITHKNTFKITKWNQDIYAAIEWVKSSFGAIYFDDTEVQLRWGEGMEVYLQE
ncbi:hypothetical protein K502DRAFT_364381 [Neoconidiobolus thromboides FSU 785]|nr:hypothetical protein K502DRAFT_364381 [Neoconidiobolus thromboides FSU 785]